MFIHNIIKIRYNLIGYLPGHPFHLISDKEMFDAFLNEDGVFNTYYPCPDPELRNAYDALRQYIVQRIDAFLSNNIEIPDWIYSYMLMEPVSYQSDEQDIAYLAEMANVSMAGLIAEFTPALAFACYDISKRWLQKQPAGKVENRPPTMFGETHVIKSLRLDQANILVDNTEGS